METLFTNIVFSNLRSWRIVRHVLFWAAWISFLTWTHSLKLASETTRTIGGINAYIVLAFIEKIIYLPCQALLTYTLLYVIILRFTLQKKFAHAAAGTLMLYALVSIMAFGITEIAVVPIRAVLGFPRVWNTLYSSLMTSLSGGSAILGFAVGIKLLKLWYEKQRDNQVLAQKNLEAELSSLKAQIHPHFLFNTLNSLYALTLQASPDAPEAVLRLSEMLRTMLYDGAQSRIPLSTEIELISNYIELERLRFGSRVEISQAWNNADSAELVIAPFVLLPFVENAFKHGVSTTSDTAWISLETSVKSKVLTFRIVNSKQECFHESAAPAPQAIASGLGLANVRKRLELLYGDRFSLRINDEGETFVVALTLELEAAVNDLIHTSTNHPLQKDEHYALPAH